MIPTDLNSLKKVESIHLLRGLTILIIVICHCYGKFHITDIPSRMTSAAPYFFFFSELTFNWTVSFVLIAGFLFQHLSHKYNVKKYYISKIKNVIIPYTIVTLVLFLISYENYIYQNTLKNSLYQFCYIWLTGSISWPLWFIPMISIIYILSPLFKILSSKNLLIISLFCMLWLMMYPRPGNNLETIVMFFYFLPVYIIGMAIRQYYSQLMLIIKSNILVVSLFIFIILFFTLVMYQIHPNFHASGTILVTPTRIFLFIFILYALDFTNQFGKTNRFFLFLSKMAGLSFPIFFVHDSIAHHLFLKYLVTNGLFLKIVYNRSGYTELLIGLIFSIVVLLLSVMIIIIIKKITGNKSRYFIGG